MSTSEEEYILKVIRDSETGNIISEKWYKDGQLHKENAGPAVRKFEARTGILVTEEYYKNGKLCREGGPAIIHFNIHSRRPYYEVWMNEHGLHRSNGLPAKTSWYADSGNIKNQEFFEFGLEHRIDGPSTVQYALDGATILFEEWRQHERLTRDGDLPAIIEKDDNAEIVVREEYWVSDVRHRGHGKPAIICRESPTGQITSFDYYEFGQEIDQDPRPATDMQP